MMPVSWKRWTLSLVAVGAVAASVSGCVPLVLGGAAVGGTVMAIGMDFLGQRPGKGGFGDGACPGNFVEQGREM